MLDKYEDSINELRNEIKQLIKIIKRYTSKMSQQLIDERDFLVQAKISALKTIAKEYEKHYHNPSMIM